MKNSLIEWFIYIIKLKMNFTFKLFILWQIFISRLGPLTFISKAVLRFSLKRTVAAKLNITIVFSMISCKSVGDNPNPGFVTSPSMATTFLSTSGFSIRITLKIYLIKSVKIILVLYSRANNTLWQKLTWFSVSSRRRQWMDLPFEGLTSK